MSVCTARHYSNLHTRTNTHTHAHSHSRTKTHTHKDAHAQRRTRTHTHTHALTHTHKMSRHPNWCVFVCLQFGLPAEFLDPSEVSRALAENEALRASTYLMLDVPMESVLIVDSRCAYTSGGVGECVAGRCSR